MNIIDTHCHLNMCAEKKPDDLLTTDHLAVIKDVVARAQAAGVHRIINVGTSKKETLNSLFLAQQYSGVFASVGIHPCDSNIVPWEQDLKDLEIYCAVAKKHKVVALGETGLDYYHKPFDAQRQQAAFRAHLELACTYNLPVIVHVREAADDVCAILAEYVPRGVRGVIHSFLQTAEFAQKIMGWGFYAGIGGPITYPSNDLLRTIVTQMPLEHIVVETDAPFLPPQPLRGKRNAPEHIVAVVEQIAKLKGCTAQEVARQTTINAQHLFGLEEKVI